MENSPYRHTVSARDYCGAPNADGEIFQQHYNCLILYVLYLRQYFSGSSRGTPPFRPPSKANFPKHMNVHSLTAGGRIHQRAQTYIVAMYLFNDVSLLQACTGHRYLIFSFFVSEHLIY